MSWSSPITAISEPKLQRDMQVSAEILAVVEVIKKHMSEQKKIRDEFNSIIPNPLENLSSELAELQQEVTSIFSGLRKNNVQAAHLSEEMLNLERSFGLVKKSQDSAFSGLQDTPALVEYFNSYLASFATRVQTYKQEIQAIEELFSSRAKPFLTPKELADVLRKLDEQFISLAALLYTVNEDVCSVKAEFLRKYRSVIGEKSLIALADQENSNTSTFDLLEKDTLKVASVDHTPYGPSPFGLSSAALPSITTASQPSVAPLPIPFQQPFASATSSTPQITASSGLGSFSLFGSSTPTIATTSNSTGLGFSFPNSLFNKPATVSTTPVAPAFNLQTTANSSFGFGLPASSNNSPFLSKGLFGK